MASINVSIHLRFTLRARLMLWAYRLAAAVGIHFDLDRAAKAIVANMRTEVR